ncbi:EAL domain-containing protein [Pseudomonas donghuensis]|uniref:EAL domain-containing protein n=1 Tax=Pseudomonas donghuensis TaxID=1163398 RepID=UPI002E13F731|nr:EAL domain-containing protein [Pseudomonas donghuensis]
MIPLTPKCLQALLNGFDPYRQASVPPTLCRKSYDHEVTRALSHGEIRPALQPKILVSTGHICGFEVLARWQRADGNILLPGAFLPTLRRAGMLDNLLFALMKQALNELHSHGLPHLSLAFNLEPVQIAQPEFADQVERLLQHLHVDPRRITFELTEEDQLQAPAISLDNLLRLRLLGCGLAIDDFGRGHSTLQRLVELPFTQLKLDASFLDNLESDSRCVAVLASALTMGRALELPVVAEGVETESQFQHLKRLGCDQVQGHLFDKPATGDALTQLLCRLGDENQPPHRYC